MQIWHTPLNHPNYMYNFCILSKYMVESILTQQHKDWKIMTTYTVGRVENSSQLCRAEVGRRVSQRSRATYMFGNTKLITKEKTKPCRTKNFRLQDGTNNFEIKFKTSFLVRDLVLFLHSWKRLSRRKSSLDCRRTIVTWRPSLS